MTYLLNRIEDGVAQTYGLVNSLYDLDKAGESVKESILSLKKECTKAPLDVLIKTIAVTSLGLSVSSFLSSVLAMPILTNTFKVFVDLPLYGLSLAVVTNTLEHPDTGSDKTSIPIFQNFLYHTKTQPLKCIATAIAITALGMTGATVLTVLAPLPGIPYIIKSLVDNSLKQALLITSYTAIKNI